MWVILGIGGGLLAVSRIGFRKQLDLPIAGGVVIAGVGLFALVTALPQYSTGFSILGTLILAGAALMAIRQSARQSRDDRLERRLGAIITWAEDIIRCETAASLSPLPIAELVRPGSTIGGETAKLLLEYHERNRRVNLVMRYQSLAMMRPRILLIARQLDREFGSDLRGQAEQTSGRLNEHVELGKAFITGDMNDDEYKERWDSLRDSAVALIEVTEVMLG